MSSGLLTTFITIMTYNRKELAALIKLGTAMAQADGHVDKIEQFIIASELKNFGVNDTNTPSLLAASAIMDISEALRTLAAMSNDQKKYACGYLAAIMAADGEIAKSEVKLWQLVCTLGSFPVMNNDEALIFWKNN